MSIQFPTNPSDGQVFRTATPDGIEILAVYSADKNRWQIHRQNSPASQQVTITPPTTTKLVDLADVTHNAKPTLGAMPIWKYVKGHPETGLFDWSTPPAHIKNWDSVSNWESGAAVYHHQQLWRATRDSYNVEPAVELGRTQLYIHVPGEPTFGILPTEITPAEPPSGSQPMGFKLGYWLQYKNDHDISVWKFVVKGLDPGTRKPIGVWEGRPWTCMVWRHMEAPPLKMPPGTVAVWIRATQGSTTAPIKGQQDWATLEITSTLSQCADVAAGTPVDGDILTYSQTDHQWVRITRAALAASLNGGGVPVPSGGGVPVPSGGGIPVPTHP